MIKLSTSSSFRSIKKIVAIFSLCLNLSIKTPTHTTILLWTKKLGCYQFEKRIDKANDWILIIDESIQFGHEKLLVIYGLRACKIDFTRSLNYKDLIPLTISAKTSWTGDLIKKEIDNIKSKVGKIMYVVADGGNAIRKSLRLSEIEHIYDITHKIAWLLKKMYSENTDFNSYTKEMAKMRTSMVLSDVAHVLPPNQRVNSRFMNLDILSDWGEKVLSFLEKKEVTKKEYIQLEWVESYRNFIKELSQINKAIKEIKHILKTKGLSKTTIRATEKILSEINIKNSRTDYLKAELMLYLKTTKAQIPKSTKMLCTSDIIESCFGKYKNYISENPMTGITNLSLCISAFTSQLDDEEVKKAMETINIQVLSNWSAENIGETNMSKRRRVLKRTG